MDGKHLHEENHMDDKQRMLQYGEYDFPVWLSCTIKPQNSFIATWH